MKNMKRIIKFFPVLTLILLLQISCNKDWLVPKPLSTLTPEGVYINKAGFEALLVTMRKNLTHEAYGNRNLFAQEAASSDLAIPTWQCDFTHKLTPNSDKYWNFLSMFTTAYSAIKDANVCISRLNGAKWGTEEERNAILAEAYWHRAYWYYRLVNSYGNVPWAGEEVQGAKLDYNTYSRWTILDKLQSDLEFAVQWLPQTAEPGAISKGAGNQLLTKIYLANLNFDKAIESATRVINGPYSLMTQRFGSYSNDSKYNVIWDIHRPENMNILQNTETILATVDRFEVPTGAKTVGLYTMRMYNPAVWNSPVKDSQGNHGTMAAGPQYDSLGRGNADAHLAPFYEYDVWALGNQTWKNTPDLRRSNINWKDLNELLYNDPASVNYGQPLNPKWFASLLDTMEVYYAFPFYITYQKQQDPKARPMGGNGDWYIYRLAETYLLRAEAYFWKGELGLAANDLNKVRQRAEALPVSAGDVNIDFIFDESARELFAESPRHSELVRVSYIMAKLNRDGYSLSSFSNKNYYYDRVMRDNILYQQPITELNNNISLSPFNVLWPISSNVITANTLGVINQNIGYDGANKNMTPIETPIK